MRLTNLLQASGISTLIVCLTAIATTAIAQTTSIKLGSRVPMLDSGQAVSYVGVPVSIKCPVGSGPTQFNLFVTQSPNVTGSFGAITAQCIGKAENFVVAVQSNFGSLYHEGSAVASANCFYPCFATASRNVVTFRLARLFFLNH